MTDEETGGSTTGDHEQLSKINIQVDALAADISDFIDENPIADIRSSMSELAFVTKRIEDLRSQYRCLHIQIMRYNSDFDKTSYEAQMTMVKKYVKSANNEKKRLISYEASNRRDERDIKTKTF